MKPHYDEVSTITSQDRRGMICSLDISSSHGDCRCVEVAAPPQFMGGIHGVWSPEHLFTAAVSGCLMTTFLAIAVNASEPLKFWRGQGQPVSFPIRLSRRLR